MEEYCVKHGIILERTKTNNGYICTYNNSIVVVDNDFRLEMYSFNINDDVHIDLYTYLFMKNEFYSRATNYKAYRIMMSNNTSTYNIVALIIKSVILNIDSITFDMNDISRIHAIMDLYPSVFSSGKIAMKFVD
jgi:hypothetical protein